jgi:hypothetical protein
MGILSSRAIEIATVLALLCISVQRRFVLTPRYPRLHSSHASFSITNQTILPGKAGETSTSINAQISAKLDLVPRRRSAEANGRAAHTHRPRSASSTHGSERRQLLRPRTVPVSRCSRQHGTPAFKTGQPGRLYLGREQHQQVQFMLGPCTAFNRTILICRW